jgi:glyoxylase-like metal-dependent hydrolase (beta-lactamase superfamily II)
MEDAAEYLESLYRVQALGVARLEPGHGAPMDDAASVIADHIEHRLAREREIIKAMGGGATTIEDVVDSVYAFVPTDLRAVATHQVIVQMTKLQTDGEVRFSAGAVGPSTMVELNAEQ